ncbi:MAG TPA: GNAT family N-acetyltransferase [Naasia sp.]
MHIRSFQQADLPTLLDLTLATFGPFYEGSYRGAVGPVVFENRHGNWRQDYADHLAALHDPERGKHAAVALLDDAIAGYVGWVLDTDARHGEIDILAVTESSRHRGVGRALAEHAIAAAKDGGAEVVSIGTGGDPFHAPARRLYESLGFIPFVNVNYTKAV